MCSIGTDGDAGGALKLTAAEIRLIHLLRQVGFGSVTVDVKAGQLMDWRAELHGHFDKPTWPGQDDLLKTK